MGSTVTAAGSETSSSATRGASVLWPTATPTWDTPPMIQIESVVGEYVAVWSECWNVSLAACPVHAIAEVEAAKCKHAHTHDSARSNSAAPARPFREVWYMVMGYNSGSTLRPEPNRGAERCLKTLAGQRSWRPVLGAVMTSTAHARSLPLPWRHPRALQVVYRKGSRPRVP